MAHDLVGAILWTEREGVATAGRIIETEAYLGEGEDPASHAHRGPTPRARVMFGPPAVAYVYFIYGMHHCFNVVTGRAGHGGAVLVRALDPLVGVAAMQARRPGCQRERELCAGPGRLCRALGIELAWNGLPLGRRVENLANLCGSARVWIAGGQPPARVVATGRVGIRAARDRPLRFCDPDGDGLTRRIGSRG